MHLNEVAIAISDLETKKHRWNEIYDMILNTYKSVPGGLGKINVSSLLKFPGHWLMDEEKEKYTAGILTRNTPWGEKVRLVFHNGQGYGKERLKTLLLNNLKNGYLWGEFSGPLAKILVQMDAPILDLDQVQERLGHAVEGYLNGWYRHPHAGVFKSNICLGKS